MLGIRQIVVLVNKMDLVDYSADVFSRVVDEYREFLGRIRVEVACFIPVSGLRGDNLVTRSENLTWYRGPTVLNALDAFDHRPPQTTAAFRMPVQGVYRFTEDNDDRRIVAGTLVSGHVKVDDEIVFYPSGKTSRVKTLEAFNEAPTFEAAAEEAIGFTLTDQIWIERGEVAALRDQPPPQISTRLKASVFWLGTRPLVPRRQYTLKAGTARVTCYVEQIHRVIDASELSTSETAAGVRRHEAADCTLVLRRPLAFDTVDYCPATGRFVLIDNLHICGGGIIREAVSDRTAAFWSTPEPAVLWFTGLSGAGKSTIAHEVSERLRAAGSRVEYLDGDAIRSVFPNTGFTRHERDEHIKRVGFLASRLEHHGVFVVCALISPYVASRAHVRMLCQRFIEVHVSTPLQECERRDVKGLYARARRGEIPHFTGVDDVYEAPLDPEIRIDTSNLTVEEAADLVMTALGRNSALELPA
jgi:bifunctional enzyme CysN/CysC